MKQKITMIENIRVVAWNANGLLQHRNEVQMFLDLNKVDVCLISEKHFTRESYLKIKEYNMYLATHPQNAARGGSAIIIKNNLLHNVEVKIETDKIQLIVIKVKTKRYKVTIAAIYCPPRHNIHKSEYLTMLHSLGEKFILGGDFNAKYTYWVKANHQQRQTVTRSDYRKRQRSTLNRTSYLLAI